MPLYEYRCTGCGKRIEALQRVSAPPLRECPTCHGVLEKLVSAPSLQFKGTGWYVTDYGKGGGRKADEGKGADESPKKETTPSAAPASGAKPGDSTS
ncbi:MAG: zinc ribbon domain-containing protein [Acidobacteria bacterium]|nr:zinc ribbon domain-containing protein [Acidobacteriota bacterium]